MIKFCSSEKTKQMPSKSSDSIYQRTVGPMANRLFSLIGKVTKGGAAEIDGLDFGLVAQTKYINTPKDVMNVPVDPKVFNFSPQVSSIAANSRLVDNRVLVGGAKKAAAAKPAAAKPKKAAAAKPAAAKPKKAAAAKRK